MRDISNDVYMVSVITSDGVKHRVPHDSLTWEMTDQEFGLRVRFTAPQLSALDWDPAFAGEGSYWVLEGGDPTALVEIGRGRIMSHDQPLASDAPLDVNAMDMMYQLLKSRTHCFYPDGTTGIAILTDLCTQWNIPIDDIQGPTSDVGPLYQTKVVSIADIIKYVFEIARGKGEGEWVHKWTSKGFSVVRPGMNTNVYWFIANESVVTGTMTSSVEDMVTRVLALKAPGGDSAASDDAIIAKAIGNSTADMATTPTVKNTPATVVATIDGHTEYGILQDAVMASKTQSGDEAVQAAQAILDLKGQPKVTCKMTVPLLPDIVQGDRHRILAGPIDGYMFVETFSSAEASRSMQIEFSAKYTDLFSIQGSGIRLEKPDATSGTDPLAKILGTGSGSGTSSSPTAGQINRGAAPVLQTNGWACSAASAAWLLSAVGVQSSQQQVTDWLGFASGKCGGGAGITDGDGLCDASGANMAKVLSAKTGIKFVNKSPVTWEQLTAILEHGPAMIGGHGWVHWTGVRNMGTADILNLANPSPGWMDISNQLNQTKFEGFRGPFSVVYPAF